MTLSKRTSPLLVIFALVTAGASAPAPGDLRQALKLLGHRDAAKREEGVAMLEEIPGRSSLLMLLDATGDEDAEVRGRAGRALMKRRSDADLETIRKKGLACRRPRVRRAALDALAAAKVPFLDVVLARAIEDADPGVREAAVEHIEHELGGRGPTLLAAAVLRGREGRPRARALVALARVDPDRAGAMAREALQDRAYEMRVAALEVVAGEPIGDSLGPLVTALRDESWSVRVTAIRALAVSREVRAIPPLIESLRSERGRLLAEAGEALATLTGIGFPPDADRWERWWEEARETFTLPERPKAPAAGESGSVATFHSIPVRSECAAFVLDRSKSMRDRLERGKEKRKGDLVEEELAKTLAKLAPPARFLLVAFGTEPVAFRPRPVRAGSCTRRAALEWFGKIRPTGRTNLFDALALALDQPDVDTIYCLTDGAPSAGEFRSRTGILREVARRNRFRKAVIHAVEIGADATGKRWRGFLRELAERTGGVHVRR